MLHHVFVSYSRRDQAWVDALVRELARCRVDFWIDREGIPFSVPWLDEVEDAVQACDLFLVCDSDHWRTSTACATEAAFGVRFDKVRLDVPVGGDVAVAAEEIGRAARHAGRLRGTATELSVRARDWDREGRRARRLAPRRLRRRFDALRGHRPLSPVERAFIAASRRRTARQAVVSVGLVLLLTAAYVSGRAVPQAEEQVGEQLVEQAEAYAGTRDALAVIEDDPYKGLELAAARGGDESVAYAVVHEEALSVKLPDDAFTVPVPTGRFTDATVSSRVRVTARDGALWTRAADDHARRSARRASDDPADTSDGDPTGTADGAAPQGTEIRLREGEARVRFFRGGELWRTVALGSVARTARLSPDARWAVVATDTGVALVDVARGTVREELRGAPAPVTDLVWTRRSERVWALAGRTAVSWRVTDGTVVLDRADAWFEDVFRAKDGAHLWVASRDGRLLLVDRDSGTVVRTARVEGTVSGAVSDPGGERAAVVDSGAKKMWTVALDTGTARPVELADGCAPGTPVFSRDGRVLYVPCAYDDVLVVDVRSRRTTGKIDVPEPGGRTVALDPSGSRLFLGTPEGDVYSVPPSSGAAPARLYRVGCAPGIEAVAVGPGSRLLPVGEGTGLSGCTQLGVGRSDGSYRWNAFIDSPPDSLLAMAADFDPSGKAFAIGYSDGSVVLHPTDNIQPRQVLSGITGGIRAMLTLPAPEPGGDTTGDLYVVTRSGLLVRVPWRPSYLSNAAMAREAARRLRQAETLGLYEPPAAPSPAPTAPSST
ncbi:toll/interleukin-1 receptor domain-containing protein [Streptomyces sp. bgisy126]|uniref:toll/interleukin-1 receptor domain-containing protein n=1 Tax=unclassified Streptomyces TaxID=2593676 RepID=UPI003EB85E55